MEEETRRRKQWTEANMVSAIAASKTGMISINTAADLHGVPLTSLKDRLSDKTVHGTNPSPKHYLSTEESVFVDHLVHVAQIGYGKTSKQVKEKVAKEKDVLKSERLSDNWWDKFMRRHQDKLFLH